MLSIAVAEDEWWEGHDFVVGITAKRVEELGVIRVDYHRLEGYESGSTGWAAADLTFVTRDDSRFRRRFTATFQLEEGVWRVVQGHASQGVPNTEAWGFELSGSLEGLVDSLDQVSAEEVLDAAVGGTVTVMFTDIEDSTQISTAKGDQAWLEMVEDHFAVLRSITERRGGRMVKTLGDGAMIIFPSAGAGIDAAMEVQRTFSDSDMAVRVGLHTGDALRMAGDYVGVTVSKAARVAAAASGGEILVSSVTAALATNPNLRFGDTREVELKGLPGLHPLVPVLWNETQ
jgi:class 3 adenylate cyclase